MGYSRKEFLKISGLSIGGIALEAFFRPIGRIADNISVNEGDYAQRYGTFSRLLNQIATHPSSPIPSQIMRSWIGFNGLEIYFNQSRLPLSTQLYRHFLYGTGQQQDISNHITRIYPPEKKCVPGEIVSSDLVDDAISRLNPPVKADFEPGNRIRIIGSTLSNNPDLNQSLGNYGFILSGHLAEISPPQPDAYPTATLNSPRIRVFDRFDWDPGSGLGVTLGQATALLSYQLNLPVSQMISKFMTRQQYNDFLCCSADIVAARDAALLVKHGYAHEFDLSTRELLVDQPQITVPLVT